MSKVLVKNIGAAALEKKIAELDALSKKYAALRAAGN